MKQDLKLHPVDELGAIRAQIADLRKLEKAAEEKVKALIDPQSQAVEGEIFRAAVVVQFRETLIAEKVREFLLPQQLRHATRTTEVHSLRVTARSTEKVA